MDIISILGLVIGVVGLLFAFQEPRNRLVRFIKKIIRRPPPPPISEEPVKYRCPLVFRRGSDFLQTSFAKPINEQTLLSQLLERHSRILVLGQAGFGKSQFASHVERYLAKEKRSYISAQRRRTGPLSQQIALQFDVKNSETHYELGKTENAFIIIDSLDEIGIEERTNLLKEVEQWVSAGASVLATARSIDSLPNEFHHIYDCFTIQPLSVEQALMIIEQWCKVKKIVNSDMLKIKNQVEGLMTQEELWAPGNIDIELSSPFYLVNACEYYDEHKCMPANCLDVLEMIASKAIGKIEPQYRSIAREMLLKITDITSKSRNIVSVPQIEESILRNNLEAWVRTKGLDYESLLDKLLDTHLIVKMGNNIAFGMHGLIYHYFAARCRISQQKVSAQDLRYEDRVTVELITVMMDSKTGVQLSNNMLDIVGNEFPETKPIKISDDYIDPRLPYFALASIKDAAMGIVDRFVQSAINRLEVNDGPTRWLAVEMLVALDYHTRRSKILIESLNREKSDVAAALAEVVCWLGHKRRNWISWALEELDRIARYTPDYHPMLHVVEAIERLDLVNQNDALELLSKLNNHENVVVKFSSISMMQSDKSLWEKLGSHVIDWIVQAEEYRLPDYVICHGYHALHWLKHSKFGAHEAIEKACNKIMKRVENLCKTNDCPPYWIWYLGRPIKQLGLFEQCIERLGQILLDNQIPLDARRFVQRFIASVRDDTLKSPLAPLC